MAPDEGAEELFDDMNYHAQRARAERDLAYKSADARASDSHMRLSALHLSRAMVLEEVDRRLGAAMPQQSMRIFS
jgi:hypothetical protein